MTVEELGREMMDLPGDKHVFIEINGELYPIKNVKKLPTGNFSVIPITLNLEISKRV